MDHKVVEAWRYGYITLKFPKSEAWACDGVYLNLAEIDDLIETLKIHRAKLARYDLGTVPETWKV